MQLPHSHSEPPRPLSLRDKYKAAEWRLWLFYTSLPILWKYMPDAKYATHWSLLVASLRSFCSNVVYTEEHAARPSNVLVWQEAQKMLFKFIDQTKNLYSTARETYHVHLLVHLPDQVLRFGPLWTCSTCFFDVFPLSSWTAGFTHQFCKYAGCFPFESAMHWLLRHHHSRNAGLGQTLYRSYFVNLRTRIDAAKQIKATDAFYPLLVDMKIVRPARPQYPRTYTELKCKDSPTRTVYSCGSRKTVVLGSGTDSVIESAALALPVGTQREDILNDGHVVCSFKRLYLDGVLYTSQAYTRSKASRRDSSVFVYKDTFGVERPAVAHCFFASSVTSQAYVVAEDLIWFDGQAGAADEVTINPLARPVPELSSALYFARVRENAPIRSINVARIQRRLLRFQPSGMRYQGHLVVALSEFVYAVSGTDEAPDHDQRQARELL